MVVFSNPLDVMCWGTNYGGNNTTGGQVVSDGTLLYTNSGEVWNPATANQTGTFPVTTYYSTDGELVTLSVQPAPHQKPTPPCWLTAPGRNHSRASWRSAKHIRLMSGRR